MELSAIFAVSAASVMTGGIHPTIKFPAAGAPIPIDPYRVANPVVLDLANQSVILRNGLNVQAYFC
jgi:hypothetical protein